MMEKHNRLWERDFLIIQEKVVSTRKDIRKSSPFSYRKHELSPSFSIEIRMSSPKVCVTDRALHSWAKRIRNFRIGLDVDTPAYAERPRKYMLRSKYPDNERESAVSSEQIIVNAENVGKGLSNIVLERNTGDRFSDW